VTKISKGQRAHLLRVTGDLADMHDTMRSLRSGRLVIDVATVSDAAHRFADIMVDFAADLSRLMLGNVPLDAKGEGLYTKPYPWSMRRGDP